MTENEILLLLKNYPIYYPKKSTKEEILAILEKDALFNGNFGLNKQEIINYINKIIYDKEEIK